MKTAGAKDGKAAMLLLHGRGADAEDILGVTKYFDSEEISYFAPDAPSHAWYPNSFLLPVEKNEPKLTESLKTVENCLKEIEKKGIPASRIFILGFSQGACLACEYITRNPGKYAGIFALAGGLIGETLGNYSGDLQGTRVFLGCAENDPYIPKKRVEESAKILEKLNAQVIKKIYPGDAHTINDDEIETINTIIKKTIS